MSTASLQVDYRTDYATNLREKILILQSRCSFCCYQVGQANILGLSLKQQAGLCSRSLLCPNLPPPGRLFCQDCTDMNLSRRLTLEMRLGIEGNMKVSSGHEVTNSNSMAIALHELRNRLQLGGGWARLVARTVSNPRSVFVVDTETGFINNQDVHEVGVITYDWNKRSLTMSSITVLRFKNTSTAHSKMCVKVCR